MFKKLLMTIVLTTIVFLLNLTFVNISLAGQRPCGLDAKICPDGTTVGRIPPDCEFAPCANNRQTKKDSEQSSEETGETIDGKTGEFIQLPKIVIFPDSFLYPFKIFGEKIVSFFIFDKRKKAERYFYLSQKRLAEVQNLSQRKVKPKYIQKTLERYQNSIDKFLASENILKKTLPHLIKENFSQNFLKHREILLGVRDQVPRQAVKSVNKAIEKSKQGFKQIMGSILKKKREDFKKEEEQDKLVDTEEPQTEEKREKRNKKEINSFRKCVEAGYQILTTHPRQCKTSDGKVFIEPETRGRCGDGICSLVEKQENLCPKDCQSINQKCKKENGFCGGIAGFLCCGGLICEYSGEYPDASGRCVKEMTKEPKPSCTENWNCASWKNCVDGIQTRICTDLNNCGTAINKPVESQNCVEDEGTSSVELLKMVEIADGARPEVVAYGETVFVVYHNLNNGSFTVKIFDKDMNNEIASKDLVSQSTEYGSPTDIRIDAENGYLYAFYETIDMNKKKSYLFGAKYRLDENFERVAYTGLIASGKTFDVAADGDEKLDDPITLITSDAIFAVTRIKAPFEETGKTIYVVREFDKNLSGAKNSFNLDLSDVVDGGARQASAVYRNGYVYMATPTTVGQPATIDIATPSDIMMVKLDADWKIADAKTISATVDDIETYVTGFQADDDNFYIAYVHRKTDGSQYNIPLKIYDNDFNLIVNENVRDKKQAEDGLRPSLEVSADRIFVGNTAGATGSGNVEIYIYKYTLN